MEGTVRRKSNPNLEGANPQHRNMSNKRKLMLERELPFKKGSFIFLEMG